MTIEVGIISFLGLIVLFQQGFYSWQIHRLLDKSMSKNYAEYIQANNQKQAAKKPLNDIRIPLGDDVMDQQDELRELNNRLAPPFR